MKVTPFQLAVEERETGFSLSLFYLSSLIEEGRIKNIMIILIMNTTSSGGGGGGGGA